MSWTDGNVGRVGVQRCRRPPRLWWGDAGEMSSCCDLGLCADRFPPPLRMNVLPGPAPAVLTAREGTTAGPPQTRAPRHKEAGPGAWLRSRGQQVADPDQLARAPLTVATGLRGPWSRLGEDPSRTRRRTDRFLNTQGPRDDTVRLGHQQLEMPQCQEGQGHWP